MNNFVIEIKAPELSNAICTLASALLATGKNQTVNAPGTAPASVPGQMAMFPAQPQAGTPAPTVAPIQATPATIPTAGTAAAPAPTAAPVVNPTPVPAPVIPAAVPTTVQEYTIDQLAVAATQLMDAGKRTELVGLLSTFGVQALTSLPKEQFGNFATKLRELGARI